METEIVKELLEEFWAELLCTLLVEELGEGETVTELLLRDTELRLLEDETSGGFCDVALPTETEVALND